MLISFCPECGGKLEVFSYSATSADDPIRYEYICLACSSEFVVEYSKDGMKICY